MHHNLPLIPLLISVNCFSDRHYTVITGIIEEEEEEEEEKKVADSFVAAFLSGSTQELFLFSVTTAPLRAGRGTFCRLYHSSPQTNYFTPQMVSLSFLKV